VDLQGVQEVQAWVQDQEGPLLLVGLSQDMHRATATLLEVPGQDTALSTQVGHLLAIMGQIVVGTVAPQVVTLAVATQVEALQVATLHKGGQGALTLQARTVTHLEQGGIHLDQVKTATLDCLKDTLHRVAQEGFLHQDPLDLPPSQDLPASQPPLQLVHQ